MINSLEFYYANYSFFEYYTISLVLIFGLVIGSFLNVVGLRLLSGESIVMPPSKCPKCGTKLKWYDNIPVLAYILLSGKCRYCKTRISIQYPLVELITAIVFLLIFLKYTFSLTTIMLCILAGACIVMCITDFREQIIFDAVSIPLIPIGLIYSFFNIGKVENANIQIFNFHFTLPEIFLSSLIGIVMAFILFEGLSFLSKMLIKQPAFGEGDTIIAMIFAAWFGWKIALISIVLGVLVQVVFTVPLILYKLIKSKDKIAIISFSGLLLSAVLPLLIKYFTLYLQVYNIFIVFVILIIATLCAITFLKRVKELNSYTFLPFGPALITGCFIALLSGDILTKFFIW